MGILSQIGRFVGNLFELIAMAIAGLIYTAIWAIGFLIDFVTDILDWINGKLEELLGEGSTEVGVVKGSALYDFIQIEKSKGNYPEISLEEANAMRTSVINVAMDINGNIVDDQMIRSNGGLSSQAQSQFRGKDYMTIKLPA